MIKKIKTASLLLAMNVLLMQSFAIADSLRHALGANGYLNNMPLYYKKCVRNKQRNCNSCKRPVKCKAPKTMKSPETKKTIMTKARHNHMKLASAINQLPTTNRTAYNK